ncbi:MAG: PAS domain S-box protein [Proteobacteria bacterium]|nr:PAS domain S-box protein [Pseudomonadota bacterium]
MFKKPSYKDLENRIRELEQAESERRQTEKALEQLKESYERLTDNADEDALRTNDERFRRLPENAPDMIYQMSLPDDEYEYVSPVNVEEELNQLFTMSLDMICIADINSATFLKVNPAFTVILGFSEDELLEKPFTEFIHPDDIDSTLSVVEKKLKSGIKIVHFENRYRCKDGRYRWLSWHSHPVPEKGITYAIARDITDHKSFEIEQTKLQKELLKQNTFIKTIMDNLPIGIGLNYIDTGQVTYLNKRWEEIYGWPKEAFSTVEHFFEKVIPDPVNREILKKQIIDDMTSGDPNRMMWEDLEITTMSGEKRIVCAINIPLMDDNLMISTVQDFTEQRKLQTQIQQSHKMEAIGTLAGGIAHDFNNVLSVIVGNISHALSIINNDGEMHDILSDVLQGTKQAQNLTHQLLTFAKGGEPIKKPGNINTILEESAKFVTSGAKSRCDFKLADDLWIADIDSGQINQVISNLVINADQSMPNGGTIRIKSENTSLQSDSSIPLPAGPYIKISIEDQGIGIQETLISIIFDPYFTTKQKGSGLGLTTAYSIIKKHGGHITVYSELNRGTVFNIYLPASSKPFQKTEISERSTHHGQGKILIMDDQESILKMIEKMINRMGYEAETVTDGREAIDLYQKAYDVQKPFDLVILDLTIPGGMGGMETMTELIKIDPDVKAVVSSGYSSDPIMANYQDYGFCGVVPKPYAKENLAELLNTIFNINK